MLSEVRRSVISRRFLSRLDSGCEVEVEGFAWAGERGERGQPVSSGISLVSTGGGIGYGTLKGTGTDEERAGRDGDGDGGLEGGTFGPVHWGMVVVQHAFHCGGRDGEGGSQRVRVLRSAKADGTVWVEQGYFVSAKGKGVRGKTVADSMHACRVR